MICDFLYSHRRGPQRNLIIDLEGMQMPTYKSMPRAACRMLSLAWDRRWEELIVRCDTRSDEAFAKTEHSGRTALHLATFNEGCPLDVAVALLRVNRHAICVEDRNCYTPLHNLGFFHGGDNLMSLFCDTAIMVEQELKGRGKLPTLSRTSPLYLAAKRDAPTSTLRILLQTRARSQWIAPITGGESYWDPQQTLDKCSSPLEILLRGRASCFVGISQGTKQQMAAMALHLGGNDKLCDSDADDKAKDQYDQSALTMWEKCLLCMKENVRTTTSNSNSKDDCDATQIPSLLHTVASLKVPMPFLLQLAVDLFPEQVIQRDDTGKYPLYHVLKANHPYATKQLLHILLQFGDNDNHAKEEEGATTLHPLRYIQECLSVALDTGLAWEGGLEDIVMANSDVLITEDRQTRLVPAFLAASQDVPLDTIFFLLRAEPQVVQISG